MESPIFYNKSSYAIEMYNTTDTVAGTPPNGVSTIYTMYNISTSLLNLLRFIIFGYIFELICLVGVVGNIMTIIVLYRHSFKETSNILMFFLAVSDLLTSTTNCIVAASWILLYYNFYQYTSLFSYYSLYIRIWNQLGLVSSLFLVEVISVERFIAVFFPFYVTRISTPFRIKVLVSFIYIFPFCCMLNIMFMIDLISVTEARTNVTYTYIARTKFYGENFKTIDFFNIVIFNNLALTVTLFLTIVFSCLTSFRILRMRSGISNSATVPSKVLNVKGMKVVKMLITVCVVTCIVTLPSSVIDQYFQVSPESKLVALNFRYLLQNVNVLLTQVGGSVNFFIYVTMSTKFKKTYKNIFCRTFLSRTKK